MVTTVVNNTYLVMGEQEADKRPQNSPLLLFLLEGTAQELTSANELTSLIGQQVEQRVLISIASHPYYHAQMSGTSTCCDRLSTALTEWLNQGFRRMLLVPWGGEQMTDTLIKATISALHAASGEQVSTTLIPVPSAHVDGVSVRRAFEGFASVQDQLNPLVKQFPGWDGEYTRFAAGDAQIVLLRSLEHVSQQPRENALEASILRSLAAALCPDQGRTMPVRDLYSCKRDGHIYGRYLVSLLCVVAELL